MGKIDEICLELEEKLKEFSPVCIEMGKDKVVGFVNNYNGNDLVIYVKEKDLTMTFGYQNAHFDINDTFSLIEHTRKYLTNEYSSVEFFNENNKSLFGGSRLSSSCTFNTIKDIVNCYAIDNEKAKQGLYEFLKNTKVIVRAINFNNTVNTTIKISYKENDYFLERIK